MNLDEYYASLHLSQEEINLRKRLQRVLGKPLEAWQIDFIHLIRGHANHEMMEYLDT